MRDDSVVVTETGNRLSNENEGRLDGWEEIAVFLGRGLRTVQRWEKEADLPVHRLFRHRRSPVHAYRKELEHWVKGREDPASLLLDPTAESQPAGDPLPSPRREVLAGWKEVAAFFGRSVRTVQRWEKGLGLPVRRLWFMGCSMPYALRSELVEWLKEYSMPADSVREGRLGLPPPHLLQAIIEGWHAQVAVLNGAGAIVAVNRAWKSAAREQACPDPNCGVGRNYVDLCKARCGAKASLLPAPTKDLTELLRGTRQSLQIRYRTNISPEKRWFLLQSVRFDFRGAVFLILIHSDVTGLLGN